MTDGTMLINGPMGLTSIPRVASFTAGFILILVCLFVIFNLVNSKSGRAIMALRDNRIAAQSVGINVTNYKLMAFVISAAMAGMAGVLSVSYTHLVGEAAGEPEQDDTSVGEATGEPEQGDASVDQTVE